MSSQSSAPYGVPELAGLATERVATREDAESVLDEKAPAEMPADERLLWERHVVHRDPAAREELIVRNLAYAKGLAGALYRQHGIRDVDFNDYVQWATLGLVEALDRYDPARGAQFRTYAHARVLGAMRNGLTHASELREQIGLHRRLNAERLAAARGDRGLDTAPESADRLLGEMAEVSAAMMLGFMLDDTGMVQGENDALPDGCYDSLAFKHEQRRVRELIEYLTPREQSVIALHYLNGMTYQEISQILGITKGRIAQLHEQALTRLRKLAA